MVRAYLTDTGTRLHVINGERDEWNEPIPYRPVLVEDDGRDAGALASRVDELERLLTQSRDLEGVWHDMAKTLAGRCERMFTDIAALTGRSRAAVRAQYCPETTRAPEAPPEPV